MVSSLKSIPRRNAIYSLVFVFFQNLVAVVFNTSQNLGHKVGWLSLEKPTQSDNALRDSAQMVEERRRPVRFPEVVDGIGSLMQIDHKFGGKGLRLLRLG